MSLFPHRGDAPLGPAARPLFERMRSGATQTVTERARLALGAIIANTQTVDADGMVHVVAWANEPGARYDRALSAGQRIMPALDPRRATFKATANPACAAVFIEGRTMVTPFEEVARNVVHPWVIRFTSLILELRWTIAAPLRCDDRIVGSFAVHLARKPTDADRVAVESFAHDAVAALDKAGSF